MQGLHNAEHSGGLYGNPGASGSQPHIPTNTRPQTNQSYGGGVGGPPGGSGGPVSGYGAAHGGAYSGQQQGQNW